MRAMAELSQNPGSNAVEALDRAFYDKNALPTERNFSKDKYHVRVPVFEGPLDLLLHLIRKEQINVYDIPIAQICGRYLDHIRLMQDLDINLAGEFMVMASTLIYLKSLMLLPQTVETQGEEDPRMPLVQQLLEYERFKLAAQKIDQRSWMWRDVYPRPMGIAVDFLPPESVMDAPLEPIDPFQLLINLHNATSRTTRPALEISADKTSIRDRVMTLAEQLETQPVLLFSDLVPPVPTAKDIVTTFLAILELAKLKFIEILQHENFGPIQIRGVRAIAELDSGLLEQY